MYRERYVYNYVWMHVYTHIIVIYIYIRISCLFVLKAIASDPPLYK